MLALPGAYLAGRLSREVAAGALERIDPRRAALDLAGAPGDERWGDDLAAILSGFEPFSPHDRAAIETLERALSAHPAVAEVGRSRVLWPDGLDVPLRLRRPAACLRIGSSFFAVSEDGVVLPGPWPMPPWSNGLLPVIGPNDGVLDGLRPGDELIEARHLDALSVALSMRKNLDPMVLEALGPPLIDATHAREASVDEPGVRILLEGGRVVRFGRAPWLEAPGELPASAKWANLARALRHLATPDGDWDVCDLRWDVPGMHIRGAPDEPGSARSTTGRDPPR